MPAHIRHALEIRTRFTELLARLTRHDESAKGLMNDLFALIAARPTAFAPSRELEPSVLDQKRSS